MRVLHLVAPGGEHGDERVAACERVIDQTRREGGVVHAVLLIGSAADEVRAWDVGLLSTDRVEIARRAGGRVIAAAGVKRWLASRGGLRGGGAVDLLQCWCLETAALAMRCATGLALSVTMVDAGRGGAGAMNGGRGAVFSVLDESHVHEAERTVRASGAGSKVRVLDLPRELGLDMSAASRSRAGSEPGAQMLERFGIDPGARVIAYATADSARGEATFFAFTLGLLRVAGVECAGVMARGLPHARRAAKFVRDHGRTWGLCETDLGMRNVLACADVCVFDDCGTGALPGPVLRGWCREMGVRLIVATEHPTPRRDLPIGVMSSARKPASVVKTILDVLGGSVAPPIEFPSDVDQLLCRSHTHLELWREMLNVRDERLLPVSRAHAHVDPANVGGNVT